MQNLAQSPVVFESQGHIYTLNGQRLPSVTQIMTPMSMMLYAGIPGDILAAAADRGTRAHEQVSNFVRFGLLETDDDTAPYLAAYMAFAEAYSPHWLESEYRIHHRTLMYAGTLDLIGYIEPDDGTGVDVVDIKTTREFHPVMLKTQLAGYAEALKSHGIKIRRYYGLQLLRDGTYRFERVEDGYKLFLHCLAIFNEMQKEKKA
jgi:hypothetical protein